MKVKKKQHVFWLFLVFFKTALAGPACPQLCTCDYYSSVHTIICNNQEFEDFPPDIPTWTTSLSFDGNFLTVLNLSAFNTSTYFEEFRIRYNEITEIIVNDAKDNSASKRGACSGIRKIYPRLDNVNLRGNRIKTLPKCLLSAWPKLKILNLAENRVRSIKDLNLVNHLYYYDSLEELHLKRNEITRLRRSDLFSPANALRKTKILDLSGNIISQLEGAVFMFLSQLKDIRLQDNQLSSIPDYAFLTLGRKVESILLHRNRINSISSRAFAGLPLLKRLDLRWNNIHCLSVETLSSCPLVDEEVPGAEEQNEVAAQRGDYRATVDFSSLRLIWLKGNPWTCDCRLKVMAEDAKLNEIVSPSMSTLSCSLPAHFQNHFFPQVFNSFNCSNQA